VADACGVPCVVTDAFHRVDPTCHIGDTAPSRLFNLAFALDVALGFTEAAVSSPAQGELCGQVSADLFPFGTFPAEASFNARAVYGFWRHECLTPKDLAKHRSGQRPIDRFPRMKNSHSWPIGYCQFFRWQSDELSDRRFRSYPSAGKFDTHFAVRFEERVMRDEMYFLHLGPTVRENWSGRAVPPWVAA
jgi:hypothetical protein